MLTYKYDLEEGNFNQHSKVLKYFKKKPHEAFIDFIDLIVQLLNANSDPGKIMFVIDKCSIVTEKATSFDILWTRIIADLEALNEKINNPNLLNKKILSILEQLLLKNAAPVQIIKILAQFKIPGIKQVTFKIAKEDINIERLNDINYPFIHVPDDYICSVLMTIMSEPCKATNVAFVDRRLITSTDKNPFTRASWDTNIVTDKEKSDAIALFMKKIEYLYYAFHMNERYKYLYHDKSVHSWLEDKNQTYEDFCRCVNQYDRQTSSTRFVFFNTIQDENPIPTKLILDLFAQNQIHALRPGKTDFEKLIRRQAAMGDYKGLSIVLDSSILDVIKVDISARNDKNLSAMDLINIYKKQQPKMQEDYNQCQRLLEHFQLWNSNDVDASIRTL